MDEMSASVMHIVILKSWLRQYWGGFWLNATDSPVDHCLTMLTQLSLSILLLHQQQKMPPLTCAVVYKHAEQ